MWEDAELIIVVRILKTNLTFASDDKCMNRLHVTAIFVWRILSPAYTWGNFQVERLANYSQQFWLWNVSLVHEPVYCLLCRMSVSTLFLHECFNFLTSAFTWGHKNVVFGFGKYNFFSICWYYETVVGHSDIILHEYKLVTVQFTIYMFRKINFLKKGGGGKKCSSWELVPNKVYLNIVLEACLLSRHFLCNYCTDTFTSPEIHPNSYLGILIRKDIFSFANIFYIQVVLVSL